MLDLSSKLSYPGDIPTQVNQLVNGDIRKLCNFIHSGQGNLSLAGFLENWKPVS
jgi:hypothetical protein